VLSDAKVSYQHFLQHVLGFLEILVLSFIKFAGETCSDTFNDEHTITLVEKKRRRLLSIELALLLLLLLLASQGLSGSSTLLVAMGCK